MKKIQVLLSTYNGEQYLAQQLDSILWQRGVQVSLLVRDDGSSDGTMEILRKYTQRHKNLSVYAGSRKGAAKSFYDLLLHADLSHGYYAFADQDDVWRPGKLARALSLLGKEAQDQPLLYAGKVIYASRDLKRQEPFSYARSRGPSFGNALMENICMGCTEVFNRALCMLVRGHLPAGDVMHDWWMYLSAAYFGKVVYDGQAYILYRQHGDNQIGMQNHWGARWKNRVRHVSQLRRKLSMQAREFQDIYGEMLGGGDACTLMLFDGYREHLRGRLALVGSRKIYRQNRLDDAACRLLLIIGFL